MTKRVGGDWSATVPVAALSEDASEDACAPVLALCSVAIPAAHAGGAELLRYTPITNLRYGYRLQIWRAKPHFL